MDVEENDEINTINCSDRDETDIVNDEHENALYSFCENNHTNWE